MAHVHTVLVVDDHQDVRESLEALLGSEGYAVEMAENGREALAKLYAGPRPCVILLDVRMPVMTGTEFRQEQLNHPAFAHIPVIALSAGNGPEVVAQLHAEAYLQKPVSIDQLLALVRKHCPQ